MYIKDEKQGTSCVIGAANRGVARRSFYQAEWGLVTPDQWPYAVVCLSNR